MMPTKTQLLDIGERLFWTLVQATLGFLVAFRTDNVYLGLAVAGLAAALKGFVATNLGNGTASTLPSSSEPQLALPSSVVTEEQPLSADGNQDA